uniref:Putative secreted protein n=1 Tax=Anopheles darlingi TaxID=43151 RepID=A0A2M4DBK7_ANODA
MHPLRMELEARRPVVIISIAAILTTAVATGIHKEAVEVVVEDVEVLLVNRTMAKLAAPFNDPTQRTNTMGGDRPLVSSIGNRKDHRTVVCGDGNRVVRKHLQEHRRKMLQI